MKVISIREPYATLIAEGFKRIETRSWKTNYRGELFIHASCKSISKQTLENKYLKKIVKNLDMSYGSIICRCNLVDCIYMNVDFLKNIAEDLQEYNLGDYQLGRYAWILEDVDPIYPILARGRLNI